jgi:hypothetical protein
VTGTVVIVVRKKHVEAYDAWVVFCDVAGGC